MSRYTLLTVGKAQPKAKKGEVLGYVTAVLHLAPSDLSGVQLCALAKLARCEFPCLNTQGRGGIGVKGSPVTFESIQNNTQTNAVQKARLRRTHLFNTNRVLFMETLRVEIGRFCRWAMKKGLIPVVRLNGTSDIRWEAESFTTWDGTYYSDMFAYYFDVQFYDYTKIPNRDVSHIPNYHLTFSYSAAPEFMPIVHKALKHYGNSINFAVVFKRELPETFMGRRVLSGDDTDLRFLDEAGVVMGLVAKGNSAKRDIGFMVP